MTISDSQHAQILSFMDLLQQDGFLQDKLLNLYPDIAADVFSFKTNPNCSCKSKIIKKLTENFSNVEQWITSTVLPASEPNKTLDEKIIPPQPKTNTNTPGVERDGPGRPMPLAEMVQNIVNDALELHQPKFTTEQAERMLKPFLPSSMWANYENVIGEIVEIDADPHKYKELIDTAKSKWFYNGMNILESTAKDDSGNIKTMWRVYFY